jgi:hypothetical protein
MKKSLYIVGVVALLSCGVAMAQAGLGSVATQLKNDVKVADSLRVIDACNTITSKISARIGFFNDNRNKHIDNYISAKENINDLLTKLDAKGYDTTKIKSDLTQYDTLLQKLSTDYSTYVTELTATQNYACGKSEGEFRDQLVIAKTGLKAVHADDVAIHDYWVNTLKPDLQTLRNSIKSSDSSSTDATTSTSDNDSTTSTEAQ